MFRLMFRNRSLKQVRHQRLRQPEGVVFPNRHSMRVRPSSV